MSFEAFLVYVIFCFAVERGLELVIKPLARYLAIPGFTGNEDLRKPVMFVMLLVAGFIGAYYVDTLAVAQPYLEEYSVFIQTIGSALGVVPIASGLHDFFKGWRGDPFELIEFAADFTEVEDEAE